MIGELANTVLIGDPRDINLNGVVFDRGTTDDRKSLREIVSILHSTGWRGLNDFKCSLAIDILNDDP